MQNFIYALIQLVHNFGAVTVAGTAASALWLVRGDAAVQRRLVLFIGWAWAIQAASGVLFGMTTFYFEGQLPDIHGIAMMALLFKAMCATAGILLAVIYLKSKLGVSKQLLIWHLSFVLGVIALSSAAFLRWFS
ncbi:MAG: hypothetical protein HY016_06110 [Nitrosomonadales bacterium]|nr:hypothetical protein [Nitrosomonadales bacterium]